MSAPVWRRPRFLQMCEHVFMWREELKQIRLAMANVCGDLVDDIFWCGIIVMSRFKTNVPSVSSVYPFFPDAA